MIFSYPKYFRYEDPKLSCTVEKNKITVKAETYAKSVEILNDQEDLVLSDNYFDLMVIQRQWKSCGEGQKASASEASGISDRSRYKKGK